MAASNSKEFDFEDGASIPMARQEVA